MSLLSHYKFIDPSIDSDIIGDKGKVTKYQQISAISDSEENAKILGKVTPEYVLIGIYELGKDWN